MAAKLPQRFVKPSATLHGDAAVEAWRRLRARARPARIAAAATRTTAGTWTGVRTAEVDRLLKRLRG